GLGGGGGRADSAALFTSNGRAPSADHVNQPQCSLMVEQRPFEELAAGGDQLNLPFLREHLQDWTLRAGRWRYSDSCRSNQPRKTTNDVHLAASPSVSTSLWQSICIMYIIGAIIQAETQLDHPPEVRTSSPFAWSSI